MTNFDIEKEATEIIDLLSDVVKQGRTEDAVGIIARALTIAHNEGLIVACEETRKLADKYGSKRPHPVTVCGDVIQTVSGLLRQRKEPDCTIVLIGGPLDGHEIRMRHQPVTRSLGNPQEGWFGACDCKKKETPCGQKFPNEVDHGSIYLLSSDRPKTADGKFRFLFDR